MQHLTLRTEPRRVGLPYLLIPILVLGACFGIVYCAYQGSLLGVIVAALVPGYGVAWVLEPVHAMGLRDREDGSQG